MANYIDKEILLRDKRVLAEIDRHLWIESEKAGVDVGFEFAKEDWLNRFSRDWMNYHMPDMIIKAAKVNRLAAKAAITKPANRIKRRSAKSYFS